MIWNERAGLVYTLQESETLADEPWPASGITPQDSPDQNGVPAGYTRRQATLTIDGGARFIRVKGGE